MFTNPLPPATHKLSHKTFTEEIRQLKVELEASVKKIVASMSTVTQKEQQKLKDVSKAKFNLWVAKELILEKLKVSLLTNYRRSI